MMRCLAVVLAAVCCVSASLEASELDLLPLGDPERSLALAAAPADRFYDCARDRELTLDELAGELVQARVVLVGEDHTNIDQKRFHARLLEAMAELESELVLGMEFFLREDQGALDRWSRGEIDTDGLLEEVEWYDRGGYRFEYYIPVMEVARSRGIPVVGLNVPREIPRTVNRSGLEGLSDEQRAEVGEVITDDSAQHRYLIGRYFGETVSMLPPGWFDNMYAAQCLWDEVMARSILGNLRRGVTMVVIVGSGHVAYDLGIKRRIHRQLADAGRPELPVATFCPVFAPPPDPGGDPKGHPMGGHGGGMPGAAGKPARFVRSLADYVGAFADTGGLEEYPRLGIQLDAGDAGAPVVSMVWPDTPAAASGFAEGDRILDLNGVAPRDLSDLRIMLARTEWGQRAGFSVTRGEEQLEIAVLLYPEVDLTEVDIAPGYTVRAAADFDPGSAEPIAADETASTRPRAVLVSRDDAPARVEVWAGEVLEEVHELDPNGRVARSLYRRARPDGTVELRYQRKEDGEVTVTRRFDRTGRPLDG